jgi:hypothetical protein
MNEKTNEYKNNIIKPYNQKRPIILCMFSGGLDSYAMAQELLTNSKYQHCELHFHHVELKNREKRHVEESLATTHFQNYLSSLPRETRFTSSVFDMTSFSIGPIEPDFVIWHFIAALHCNANYAIKLVTFGVNAEAIRSGLKNRGYYKRSQEVFLSTLTYPRRFSVDTSYPVAHLSKKQSYETLPNSLKQLFWSCRFPTNWQALRKLRYLYSTQTIRFNSP